MDAQFQPYPAYKPSGVEWLEDVPSHWGVVPNRRNFEEMEDRGHPEQEMLSVTIARGVIKQQELLENPSERDGSNLDRSAYKLVSPGEIVYNKMRAWQGSIGVSLYCGIVSPAYVVQRISGALDPRYVHHLFRIPSFATEAQRWSYGIASDMWSLRVEHFKQIYSCIPPLPEQVAIVRYLDHTDGRIRRYIDAKERLIALLEEEKQAVINRAVTRGLDANVPLKPSGVQWLGDVPAHWEVEQLGRIGKFSKGSGGTKEDEVSDGLPCVRYGDIYMSHKYFIHQSRSCIAPERAPAYTPIQRGDILFAGSGETLEEIGKSAVNLINGEAYCGGDVILFRPATRANHVFMGYVCDSLPAIVQKSQMGRGITVMHIYSSELKYLWVALPPKCEQDAMVAYLETSTTDLDKAIAGARRQIELLREYRIRLISDAVTGKLDVREAAANLPDEGADSNGPTLA